MSSPLLVRREVLLPIERLVARGTLVSLLLTPVFAPNVLVRVIATRVQLVAELTHELLPAVHSRRLNTAVDLQREVFMIKI